MRTNGRPAARWSARVLAGMVIAGALLVATALPASAHAVLQSSNPAAGSQVTRVPAELTLSYNESVEVSLGSIRLFNCAGGRITVGAPHHPEGKGSEVGVALPTLSDGTYVVTWRVISADSHPVHGAFTFRVGTTGQTAAGACSADTKTTSSETVGVLFGATRWLVFAGLALLIGAIVFLFAIAWGTGAARVSRRIASIGWIVTVVSTLLSILFQGPYAAGSGVGDAFKWSVVSDILNTNFGHVAVWRLLFLVVALGFLVLERRGQKRTSPHPAIVGFGAVVGLALSATPGLAGHAATGDNTAIAIPLDTLHVAAMSAWLGGLVALVVAALRGTFDGELRRALVRFSALATGCVIVLVATGVFASWRQVGFKLDGYLHTSFGNILLVKLGFVALLIAAGGFSRAAVRRRAKTPADAPSSALDVLDERVRRALRRSVGGELLVAVAVLVATALLVNAQPARSALSPKVFSAEAKAGAGANAILIDVTLSPAKVGLDTLHVYTLNADGTNLTIRAGDKLSATMTLPSKNVDAPISQYLQRAGTNHFIATDFPVSDTGKWALTIHVLRGQFNDVAATFDVPIR